MNILLVSQCDKRALTETRRILDQFAQRKGDRTWQTPITKSGLDTLRRLLRQTARKNTAVACHWMRGMNHSELLWVVGDRGRFNEQGTVPTNTTQRNILRKDDENDWHSGNLIRLMTDLAGLLHDLGKAMDAFQERLQGTFKGRNRIRHEWVSLRLFEAFVGNDDDATWLARLASPSPEDDERWQGRLCRDGLEKGCVSPFKTLSRAPLASAIGWLVVTHHRLPILPQDDKTFTMTTLPGLLTQVEPAWNEVAFTNDSGDVSAYWRFSHGLPVTTDRWRQRASRIARKLSRLFSAPQAGSLAPLDNPFVMHLSRLSLMLADHHYSRLEGVHSERVEADPGYPLLANTRKDGSPNQRLDEHLLGVAQHGAEIARFLPSIARNLPCLGRHRRLKQRTHVEKYRWQDRSSDLVTQIREQSQQNGAFIVNMASTGCGKTLANARMMYALADPAKGMRCAFALGLRTLTLQTGEVFRQILGLGDDELAIRVGGSANRELFKYYEDKAEKTGSASRQGLIDEDNDVLFEGVIDQDPLLRRAIADVKIRKLLLAPLLVCTIDHLIPATESQRGGRQIAPMLRLMSGDLVLDEPDDFDIDDLPALTRLVHWAGLLGSRVLLSSATLPPALVQGLFEAYLNGRWHFQRNCAARPSAVDAPPAICCAWMDEFDQQTKECSDAPSFEHRHVEFAQQRAKNLTQQASKPCRSAVFVPLHGFEEAVKEAENREWPSLAKVFAPHVLSTALNFHHAHHSVDLISQKRVSFGLIRMANIEPLYEVALALFREYIPENVRVHLCVYHSQHPLLIRSHIENQLDQALNRHDPDAVFAIPDIRHWLETFPEPDQLFIVLGSPVTEVGRDHDYDWAVAEPSSVRSMIQLGGRVRRHRSGIVTSPNIGVFTHNLRHFRSPGKAAFCRPGFETDDGAFRLTSHDLRDLILPDQLKEIDARLRIVASTELRQHECLADLEHARMRAQMLPRMETPIRILGNRAKALTPSTFVRNASTWWHQRAQDTTLTGILQQKQPFRKETGEEVTLVLLPDENSEEARLHRLLKTARRGDSLYVEVNLSQCKHLPDNVVFGDRIQPWGITNYMEELKSLASARDLSLDECARRYGQTTVRENDNGWRYHPALGFARR